jgi:hypothetical protein
LHQRFRYRALNEAAFVAAAACAPRPTKAIHATLFEVDPKLASELKETMEACKWLCSESNISFKYEIFTEDFIHDTASALASPMLRSLAADYDCVILNPPYRKLNSETTTRKTLSAAGIEVNNLYSAFLALAARLLRPDGELAGITPRSFCNGPYFKAFRYDFFSQVSLRAIHVYESRSDAFREDFFPIIGGEGISQQESGCRCQLYVWVSRTGDVRHRDVGDRAQLLDLVWASRVPEAVASRGPASEHCQQQVVGHCF